MAFQYSALCADCEEPLDTAKLSSIEGRMIAYVDVEHECTVLYKAINKFRRWIRKWKKKELEINQKS